MSGKQIKIYVDHSPSSGEWERTSILELSDNGRFSYHEILTSHGGNISAKAEGSWRQSDEGIFFLAGQIEGYPDMGWVTGQEWKAFEKDNCLIFPGSFTLYLRDEMSVIKK